MRLPCEPNDTNKTHFLTDYYANLFDLNLVPFVSRNSRAYLKFYNLPKVRIEGIRNFVILQLMLIGICAVSCEIHSCGVLGVAC